MPDRRWTRILRVLAGILAGLLVLILLFAAYLWRLNSSLPDLETAPAALDAARTSVVYAADGSVIAEWHGEEDRKVVRLDAIPQNVRNAVIAAEDPRFYEHDGVDTGAVLAALRGTPAPDGSRSTITLQLVRLLFADRGSNGLTRALMAYEIEAHTSKDRVLESYLNLVYLGNGRYGVESAARGYFGRSAKDLSLAEAALLGGVIRSPSKFAPTTNAPTARARRDAVLAKMRELGMITPEQEVSARAEGIALTPPTEASVAPYFVEYVKQQLIDSLGSRAVFAGGLRVQTTLQPALQAEMERAAQEVLNQPNDPEAAIVSVDPRDGQILAMVGGRDFKGGQYNLAVQGRRQPGSAFKPFVLVTALEQGISPDRLFDTSPYTVRVKDGYWRVENYENGFTTGQLTLRAATDWSVNAVYARLMMEVGAEKVVETARKMGITTKIEANPAIALGGLSKGVSPLEMASAFGTLAAGGLHAAPFAVAKVEDDRGTVLFETKPKPERAVSQAVAAQASGMLHDVVERGTATAARFGGWAAGKTGTTQSYRDAWFVGYTGEVSTAVWVGYRQAQVDMLNVHGIKVTGGSLPAQIWSRYMAKAAGLPRAKPAGPEGETSPADSGLVPVRICRASFLLANPRCPDVYQVELEPALVPASTCALH